MKKILVSLFLLVLCASPVSGHVLEDIWNKYAPRTGTEERSGANPSPGRIIGKPLGKGLSSFHHKWKYRSRTYELHYDNPDLLARSIYSLAVHAGDISPELAKEKFYRGALGFHYSAIQICNWLNAAIKSAKSLVADENALVGMLLADGVIKVERGKFTACGVPWHVLGAAPGKKRTFEQNLQHERLHVLWDEDAAFKDVSWKAWSAMTAEERDKVRGELKNYNQNNEKQLVEEWAVKRAESSEKWLK